MLPVVVVVVVSKAAFPRIDMSFPIPEKEEVEVMVVVGFVVDDDDDNICPGG